MKITLRQRIEVVEWVNAMGFSFYSITRAKNTNPMSPVKEIRVPTMSDMDQSFWIDNLGLTDQTKFVEMLTERMGPLVAERIPGTEVL